MIIDPLDVKGDGGHVVGTLKRLHDHCRAPRAVLETSPHRRAPAPHADPHATARADRGYASAKSSRCGPGAKPAVETGWRAAGGADRGQDRDRAVVPLGPRLVVMN